MGCANDAQIIVLIVLSLCSGCGRLEICSSSSRPDFLMDIFAGGHSWINIDICTSASNVGEHCHNAQLKLY